MSLSLPLCSRQTRHAAPAAAACLPCSAPHAAAAVPPAAGRLPTGCACAQLCTLRGAAVPPGKRRQAALLVAQLVSRAGACCQAPVARHTAWCCQLSCRPSATSHKSCLFMPRRLTCSSSPCRPAARLHLGSPMRPPPAAAAGAALPRRARPQPPGALCQAGPLADSAGRLDAAVGAERGERAASSLRGGRMGASGPSRMFASACAPTPMCSQFLAMTLCITPLPLLLLLPERLVCALPPAPSGRHPALLRLQPSMPPAVTVAEAIHDLPLLLGGGGGKAMPAGRACLPYRPSAAAAGQAQCAEGGTSRYVQYMRRHAVPGVLLYHERRLSERGASAAACTAAALSPPEGGGPANHCHSNARCRLLARRPPRPLHHHLRASASQVVWL